MASARKILLVDDHDDTLRVLSHLLRLKGYEVTTAISIRQALMMHGRMPCDVLVSDITLPDGTGLDLMQELGGGHSVRGIAVSGHGSPEEVRECERAGFRRHLHKPISFGDLLTALEETLSAPALLPSEGIRPACDHPW